MSLFDDNFVVSMEAEEAKAKEAEAKEAKDDDEKAEDADADAPADDDAKGEGDDEVEAEEESLSEYDVARVNEAVEADIEAASIEEAIGFESLLVSESEDIYNSCCEAVNANMAFEQCDLVCTEAYITASSQYEKDMVTENFKESVKKFGERFKQFLIRIKNAIIRIFNKAVNYVKVMCARVSAKFASRIKLPTNWTTEDTIRANAHLLDVDFTELCNKVFYTDSPIDKIKKLMGKIEGSTPAKIKEELAAIEIAQTSDMVKAAFDSGKFEWVELKLMPYAKKADGYINQLKDTSKAVKSLKVRRDDVYDAIGKAEKAVKSVKDIDNEKITVLTMCVNKAMSAYNRMVNATVKLLIMWINARVAVIRKLKSSLGNDGSKTAYAATDAVKKESADLFEQFMAQFE